VLPFRHIFFPANFFKRKNYGDVGELTQLRKRKFKPKQTLFPEDGVGHVGDEADFMGLTPWPGPTPAAQQNICNIPYFAEATLPVYFAAIDVTTETPTLPGDAGIRFGSEGMPARPATLPAAASVRLAAGDDLPRVPEPGNAVSVRMDAGEDVPAFPAIADAAAIRLDAADVGPFDAVRRLSPLPASIRFGTAGNASRLAPNVSLASMRFGSDDTPESLRYLYPILTEDGRPILAEDGRYLLTE
jgi:hypothetical protein